MRSLTRQEQSGFSLVELVMVIVIIGVLAKVAIPKFTSLTTDAQLSATKGVAGVLGAASSSNYSIRINFSSKGVSITNCTMVANAMQGGLPAGYTVASGAVADGAAATCTITGQGSQTATFIAQGIN